MSECPRCGLQWDHTATFRSPGARSERHTWAAPTTGIDVERLARAVAEAFDGLPPGWYRRPNTASPFESKRAQRAWTGYAKRIAAAYDAQDAGGAPAAAGGKGAAASRAAMA